MGERERAREGGREREREREGGESERKRETEREGERRGREGVVFVCHSMTMHIMCVYQLHVLLIEA